MILVIQKLKPDTFNSLFLKHPGSYILQMLLIAVPTYIIAVLNCLLQCGELLFYLLFMILAAIIIQNFYLWVAPEKYHKWICYFFMSLAIFTMAYNIYSSYSLEDLKSTIIITVIALIYAYIILSGQDN